MLSSVLLSAAGSNQIAVRARLEVLSNLLSAAKKTPIAEAV
jgi:hypothetical protein